MKVIEDLVDNIYVGGFPSCRVRDGAENDMCLPFLSSVFPDWRNFWRYIGMKE